MSQDNTYGLQVSTTPPLTGANEVTQTNLALAALASLSSGTSAPTKGPGAALALVTGQEWLNTTTPTANLREIYDGSQFVQWLSLDTVNHRVAFLASAASGYYLGSNLLALFSTNYHVIYEPAGNGALTLGNANDPTNYLDNTTTYIRARAGASNYAAFFNGHSSIYGDLYLPTAGKNLYFSGGVALGCANVGSNYTTGVAANATCTPVTMNSGIVYYRDMTTGGYAFVLYDGTAPTIQFGTSAFSTTDPGAGSFAKWFVGNGGVLTNRFGSTHAVAGQLVAGMLGCAAN